MSNDGGNDGTESDVDAFEDVTTAATDDRPVTELDAVPAAGDFDRFFVEHHASMVRALALALGDDELGRDAAAEGFARALQRWRRVAGYANPSGWVYRVGLNWGRSRWRKRRREVGGLTIDAAATPAALADPALPAALRRLSTDHRAVVVGRYYLDWSEAQLAEALGVAPGTVKSRLSRALSALAEILEDDDG